MSNTLANALVANEGQQDWLKKVNQDLKLDLCQEPLKYQTLYNIMAHGSRDVNAPVKTLNAMNQNQTTKAYNEFWEYR